MVDHNIKVDVAEHNIKVDVAVAVVDYSTTLGVVEHSTNVGLLEDSFTLYTFYTTCLRYYLLRSTVPVVSFGATRGVTVSISAFLASHQCYCAGSSLAWGLNLRAVVCGIFGSSSPGVFSGYSGFLPSFIGLMVQPIK